MHRRRRGGTPDAGENGDIRESSRDGIGSTEGQTDANGVRLPVFYAEVHEALPGAGAEAGAEHHNAGVRGVY